MRHYRTAGVDPKEFANSPERQKAIKEIKALTQKAEAVCTKAEKLADKGGFHLHVAGAVYYPDVDDSKFEDDYDTILDVLGRRHRS